MPDPDVAGLLAGATERETLQEAPGKSGARLERLVIGGERYVLKHMDPATDWTIRVSGSLRGASLTLWDKGILARLPDCLNQPIVGVAVADRDGSVPWDRYSLLMRDVGSWLVPATDDPIPPGQHRRFLAHMARMHASFWDCGNDYAVVPEMHRYLELSPWMAEAEADLVVTPLARDPGPLVDALAGTPHTFVHGNWKLDNLGTDDQGRTVLLDWEQPGLGAPLSDLAWYLAINCRRLPQAKEYAIEVYRAELEALGIATKPWWDRQLALCLLGALVQFGWEKALGGYDEELRWWERKAVAAAPLLG